MESALMEWKRGNIEVARDRFRSGTYRVKADVHRPLLEAWLQMEKNLGNEEEVQRIEERLKSMSNARKAKQIPAES